MPNKRLKQMRNEKGFTQIKLARVSGVPIRNIRAYENGSVNINQAAAETVLKLATALDCTVEDLIE